VGDVLEVRGAQTGIACGRSTPCPAWRGPVLRAPPCCLVRSPSEVCRGSLSTSVRRRCASAEVAGMRGCADRVCAGEARLLLAVGDLHAPGWAQGARDPFLSLCHCG
jgi:hypothetical protein